AEWARCRRQARARGARPARVSRRASGSSDRRSHAPPPHCAPAAAWSLRAAAAHARGAGAAPPGAGWHPRPSKQPGKVIGAVADLLRQDRQAELLTKLRADERQHRLDLALTQPGWGWASRPGTGVADRAGRVLAHRCTASSWAAQCAKR